MIKSIFIANRGEIAVRIIRACKEMDITSVIGYSQADKDTMAVRMADKKICIGSNASADSYLNIANIVSAASGSHCDALHPGVGFMSERADFAEIVLSEGIEFIGPRPKSIALLGDKVAAKDAAKNAGVPVVPGTKGAVSEISEAKEFIKEHGYPIIIKAASGGGGKGMRIINSDEELEAGFSITSIEAEKSFGDKRIYIERFLTKPRHVEIQMMADRHGNIAHLGERDCSVQFRHQKLIEESPSPVVSEALRQRMGEASVRLLQSIGYENAGTVEYLLDGDEFYFMEVNTRIQVEHPVTELVTGIDLIREQIQIASGEKMSFTQEDISLQGYAMECRINAITPGRIESMRMPGGIGVRVDASIESGDMMSPFYDSMMVKVLVHAKNRREGIIRMLRALDELDMQGGGFSYNKDILKTILQNNVFQSGIYTIQFLEQTGIIELFK